MTEASSQTLATSLQTCFALLDQFQRSLSTTSLPQNAPPSGGGHASPLLLLKAAAESLKSTTTKLSLLIITPPFTPSAVVSLLKPLNEATLPSLVTATLLTAPHTYPDSFCNECSALALRALQDLKIFLALVDTREKDGRPEHAPSNGGKQSITEATGRVWESCDAIVEFARSDVAGFVVRKAEQWLALMKDAVQELQEWDPAEEFDEDDPFGEAESDDEDNEKASGSEKDSDRAAISAGVKDQVLKVLSRIPQSIHVVIKQRLAKLPSLPVDGPTILDKRHQGKVNKILKQTKTISEAIDESAEAMYMGNLELCLKKAGEARATTIDVVESVLKPWNVSVDGKETKEDTFIKRALLWIQQVEPTGADSKSAGQKAT